MKLVRYDGGRIGVVREGVIFDVTDIVGVDPAEFPPVGMIRLIKDFARLKDKLAAGGTRAKPLAEAHLETPVPWPNKLIAYPVNYRTHQEETGLDYSADTRGFFLKANSSLSGASEPIVLPDLPSHQIHHEAELGIVIGEQVRHVTRDQAMKCIFGYSCLLDITVRDRSIERVMRKSYDTFTPVGPWLVTADEVGDPTNLDLKLWVGDELRQSANTRDLFLDIPEMIVMAASVMTLYPGDVIATGTPGGVASIKHGERVTIEIERVGRMTVDVVQGAGGYNRALKRERKP